MRGLIVILLFLGGCLQADPDSVGDTPAEPVEAPSDEHSPVESSEMPANETDPTVSNASSPRPDPAELLGTLWTYADENEQMRLDFADELSPILNRSGALEGAVQVTITGNHSGWHQFTGEDAPNTYWLNATTGIMQARTIDGREYPRGLFDDYYRVIKTFSDDRAKTPRFDTAMLLAFQYAHQGDAPANAWSEHGEWRVLEFGGAECAQVRLQPGALVPERVQLIGGDDCGDVEQDWKLESASTSDASTRHEATAALSTMDQDATWTATSGPGAQIHYPEPLEGVTGFASAVDQLALALSASPPEELILISATWDTNLSRLNLPNGASASGEGFWRLVVIPINAGYGIHEASDGTFIVATDGTVIPHEIDTAGSYELIGENGLSTSPIVDFTGTLAALQSQRGEPDSIRWRIHAAGWPAEERRWSFAFGCDSGKEPASYIEYDAATGDLSRYFLQRAYKQTQWASPCDSGTLRLSGD